MGKRLDGGGQSRLEGLCAPEGQKGGTLLRGGRPAGGVERLAARFQERRFALHRHDSYAIGITTAGVQAFHYRGVQRHCLPGEAHLLFPDELHDGTAAEGNSFAYRILYLDPGQLQQALGGRPLPFVADPVVRDPALLATLAAALEEVEAPLTTQQASEILVALADLLQRLAGSPAPRRGSLPMAALMRVREAIAADPTTRLSAADLERLAGLDRWSLARQFRTAFGTSPSRFRTMRQLALARSLMAEGEPLARVAAGAGFADQSHMTRLFKRSYGLTPGQWLTALGTAAEEDLRL